jgi:hypothetical protein
MPKCKNCGVEIPTYSKAHKKYYEANKKRLNRKRTIARRKAKMV